MIAARALLLTMVICAVLVGCGDNGKSGGSSNPSPAPQETANHPLVKMSAENVVQIHAALQSAEHTTDKANWPTLSGYRLYAIVQEELQLKQDLIVSDLDQRMFLRLHALLMDQSFHVREQIVPQDILKELNYEFYRGRL